MNDNKDNLKFNQLRELLKNNTDELYSDKSGNDIFLDNTNNQNGRSILSENNNVKINNVEEKSNNQGINLVNNTDNSVGVVADNNEKVSNQEVNLNFSFDNSIVQPNKIALKSIVPEEKDENVNQKINYNKKDEVRNITLINNGEFSEDILENDDFVNKFSFLTNKKFLYVIAILLFISVCIVVAKAFYFGKKVDHYEEFFTEITEKSENAAKVYAGEEIDSEILKKVAATELINCISSPVDMNKLPDSITSIINEINNYYNSSNNYFAFAYKDIFTGFTVSYNANQNIFTASAIKAPTDIYIWEMASQGKVNLDEMVTYTGNYYNTGSGLLKNKPINTKYSVRTLLQYSTVDSDNAAHNMLMDKYGRVNMLNFWKGKGTNAIFTANNNWGVFNAHDCLIYMEELYRFYASDSTYGEAVMKNFLNSYPKFNKGIGNYKIASKSGWSGTALHDVSIIFADNPYIIVSLSNMGTSNYTGYFSKASDLAGRLHNEYWKYKMNTCNNIKQYN